ncbi:hypothetical protein [Desulfosarcina sp.]|uniref:hypothetical protein n=1 Tax=Desulfosarcina sp. TaxID=2027861 RepID=UPI0039706728
MAFTGGHGLTTALAYITAAWINHPTTTGIDHLKTTAVVGNALFTDTLFVFLVRLTDFGFFIGHGKTSSVSSGSHLPGHINNWFISDHPVAAGGFDTGAAVDWGPAEPFDILKYKHRTEFVTGLDHIPGPFGSSDYCWMFAPFYVSWIGLDPSKFEEL